jgi:hypothetical protein
MQIEKKINKEKEKYKRTEKRRDGSSISFPTLIP